MRKFICVLFSAFMLLSLFTFDIFAFDNEEYYNVPELKGTTINVYNWGEYISDEEDEESYMFDINSAFEELTGITVNYTNFASNEDLYAKLKSGGSSYDIVIPSDYMISRFIAEGLVQKINMDNIPNYKNISDKYKNLYYDENNEYSVPYCVNTVGLIYNKTMVDEKPTSWSVLWDPKYAGKILMFDNPRDSFAISQKLLGQSFNTTDSTEWRLAADELISQKPLLQGYVMDEVYDKMEAGEAALAPYYAGDFLCMLENNPDLDFVYPKEGVNSFVDAVCIPSNAENVKAAELYINYLLDPKVGLANAYATGYETPNKVVVGMEEYAEMAQNKYLYPDEEINTEFFYDLDDETRTTMNELWNEVKANGDNSKSLYIAYAVTGAIIVGFMIYKAALKRYRESFYDA